MAEVVLFHHAQGLTAGVRTFADELRAAGHVVHTPDLYDGNTFTELSDGMAYAKQIGTETIGDNAVRFAEGLSNEIVYGGFSLGGMSAQKLAQTRSGAKGCLLLHTAIPLGYFGDQWPQGVPLQIHTSEADEYGDADVAQELADKVDTAEVFLYPADQHLFTDNSLSDYEESAATQVKQRVLEFLGNLDS